MDLAFVLKNMAIKEMTHPKMKRVGLDGPFQCSKLKSSVPFKWVLGLQKIPPGKQPFKT
jgi:hypothetical protein